MKKSYCTHFQNIKNEKFCNILKDKKLLSKCESTCNPPPLSPDLWLCLECCLLACGRYDNKCSLKHYKKSNHALSINLKSLKIWCYDCDMDFDEMLIEEDEENSKKKKKNVNIEKLKTFKEKIEKAVLNHTKTFKNEKIEEKTLIEEIKPVNYNTDHLFGLRNIGNTCFFNSVMQCLNATTELTKVYLKNQNFMECHQTSESEEQTEHMDNDGWIKVSHDSKNNKKNKGGNKGKQKNQANATTVIQRANINKSFQEFLIEARRSKHKSYDPSPLFKSISNLFVRFRGYAQQDAQELLRFFLDALSIGEEKICKSHAPQISEFKGKSKVTYIENIFGAYLCNYLKCLNPECGYESRTFDFFLDLAVNIPEPPRESKKEEVYVAKPSTSRKRKQQKPRNKKEKKIKITEDAENEEEIKQDTDNEEEKNEEIKQETQEDKQEKKHEETEKNEVKHENNDEKAIKEEKEVKIEEEVKKEAIVIKNGEEQKSPGIINSNPVDNESELPFKAIDNSKLFGVPYMDQDVYLLYEPNYKIHKVNYQEISVEDCLEDFFNYEVLNIKDNYFSCEKCKKNDRLQTKAIKKFFLYEPPPVLTIVLKRFMQKSVGKFEKNCVNVKIPLKLNLDKFTLLKAKKTVDEYEIHSNKVHNYDLYGIVVHSGTISGGHYIAYAKFDENWFIFSDTDFRMTKVENVIRAEPYILFYKKSI